MKKKILGLLMLAVWATAVPNLSADGGDVAAGLGLGAIGGLTLGTILSQKRNKVSRRQREKERLEDEIYYLEEEIDELEQRKQKEKRTAKTRRKSRDLREKKGFWNR